MQGSLSQCPVVFENGSHSQTNQRKEVDATCIISIKNTISKTIFLIEILLVIIILLLNMQWSTFACFFFWSSLDPNGLQLILKAIFNIKIEIAHSMRDQKSFNCILGGQVLNCPIFSPILTKLGDLVSNNIGWEVPHLQVKLKTVVEK
jgi:uncharacterized integral membrane protein